MLQNFFSFVDDEEVKEAFVPDKPFYHRLVFAGKALIQLLKGALLTN